MRKTSFFRFLMLASFASVVFSLCSSAQALPSLDDLNRPSEAKPTVTSAELAKVQVQCTSEIERIQTEIDQIKERDAGQPTEYLQEELELWERLELITAQRESSLDDRIEFTRQQRLSQELRLALDRTNSPTQKPCSFIALDGERDKLLAAQQEKELLAGELDSEVAFLLEAKQQLEASEQARRATNTSISSGEGPLAELRREHALLEKRCRVNRSAVALHREHCEVLKLRLALAETHATEMQGRINSLAKNVVFRQEDLDQHLAIISTVEQDIQNQLSQANRRLQKIMKAMRKRPRSNSNSSPGTPLEPESTLELESAELESAREETQLLHQLLAGFGEARECWQNRFHLANGNFESSELETWLADTRADKQRRDRFVEKIDLRVRQRQNALAMLLIRKSVGDFSDQERLGLESHTVDMERLVNLYSSARMMTTGGQRMRERFIGEMNAYLDTRSWSEVAAGVGRWISMVWFHEITSVSDQPITVSTIACGIMLLLVGYVFSWLISSFVARFILPRLGLGQAAVAPVRTVILYLLMIAFTLLALDVVNVPLTVFAFMGGAIAIGAGFGSQNLINNFISGLILLAERPIRIGDLVNVDGLDATIEKIGARCTTVRTGSNLDILVPNSKFLENNVTNWTLSGTQIRASIAVGVSYGSPVKSVMEILDLVVRSHPLVHVDKSAQAPIILFKDFSDNSLAFEVHFWIHMQRMMDCRRIESDLRVEIDAAFRENGITIAFPQRDVHLDFKAPIEVTLNDSAQSTLAINPQATSRAA